MTAHRRRLLAVAASTMFATAIASGAHLAVLKPATRQLPAAGVLRLPVAPELPAALKAQLDETNASWTARVRDKSGGGVLLVALLGAAGLQRRRRVLIVVSSRQRALAAHGRVGLARGPPPRLQPA